MGDCCTVTWCCGLDFIQTYKEVKESAVVSGPIMLIIINTRAFLLELGPKDIYVSIDMPLQQYCAHFHNHPVQSVLLG